MENFGGETEKARKELTALILDNKSELLALDSQRESIIAELDQPVDLSIFYSFNALATKLNASGENILLADENFSAQAEHELNASLVSRQHELSVEREANVRAVDTLADRLVKIPEIELNSQFLIDQKAISERLDQGVKDAGGYQELLNAHEKSTSDV
jgi:exonuclease SbcC